MTSIQKIIASDIEKRNDGDIFSLSSFMDYGNYETVRKVLQRLEKAGVTERITGGLYFKKGKGMEKPGKDAIAEAIAARYGWTIAPSGDMCLFLLGLSGFPADNGEYLSSGPCRKYEILGEKISFCHCRRCDITGLSPVSVTVVQALKKTGRENITIEELSLIRKRLSAEERRTVLKETEHTTEWVFSVIKALCI